MNGSIRPRGCITRRPVWLIITAPLGLALGPQVATAKDWQRETPVPADVHLLTPSPAVPDHNGLATFL